MIFSFIFPTKRQEQSSRRLKCCVMLCVKNLTSRKKRNHIKLTLNICLYSFSWHVTQSGVSQKHANFRTFPSFSCIPFELLSFLPSVYKTNIYKLSIPLHLKAIIKIFRSGFLDFWLAIQTYRRDVHATCKHWP